VQELFYQLAAARYFQSNSEGVTFADIQSRILRYCLKEKRFSHKALHKEKLKEIIQRVARQSRDANSNANSNYKWYPIEPHEFEQHDTPEDIAKLFEIEDVALQEACNAAEYKLMQMGIVKGKRLGVPASYLHLISCSVH